MENSAAAAVASAHMLHMQEYTHVASHVVTIYLDTTVQVAPLTGAINIL